MAFLEPRREDGHADEQHKKSEYAESDTKRFFGGLLLWEQERRQDIGPSREYGVDAIASL
jgi:hypothetical protein